MTMVGGTTRQSHFRITRFSNFGSICIICCVSSESLAALEMEILAFSSANGRGTVGAVAMTQVKAEAVGCWWESMARS